MIKRILPLLLIFLVFVSCKKDDTITPTTVTQTSLTNTIIGKAWYYDYINKKHRNSFITAKVIGSNDEVIKSTITDSSGVYTLTDIPQGTYDIHLTKSGYSTMIIKSVQNLNGPKPTYIMRDDWLFTADTAAIIENTLSTITEFRIDSFVTKPFRESKIYWTFKMNPNIGDSINNMYISYDLVKINGRSVPFVGTETLSLPISYNNYTMSEYNETTKEVKMSWGGHLFKPSDILTIRFYLTKGNVSWLSYQNDFTTLTMKDYKPTLSFTEVVIPF
jgi:hypothetical protein